MLRRSSAARRNTLARPTKRNPGQVARLRLGLVGGLIAVLFLAMFARLYSLQVLNTGGYAKAAVLNSVHQVTVQPPRGDILTRTGKSIVGSRVTEAVTLSQYVYNQNTAVAGRLAAVLHMTPAAVRDAVTNNQFSPYAPVPIATNVPKADIVYIAEHQSEFPGVSAQAISERTYPAGDTAAQLLGYLTPVNASEVKTPQYKNYPTGALVGQAGVESSYNSYLYGKPGTTDLSVNRSGQVVGTVASTTPTPGDSVQLNLDLGLQQTLETALNNAILSVRGTYVHGAGYAPAPGGAAVVIDPQNGHVLAMASNPTYNPGEWVGGISNAQYTALTASASNQPLFNRAIQGLYTPGSTFKLATATAALNTGLIIPSFTYNDTGVFTARNCTGKCTFYDQASSPQGVINLPEAITASDDGYFYNLGDIFYEDYEKNGQYGFTPIQKAANAYGLGVGTGVDLPSEQSGQVDSYATDQADCAAAPKAYSCPAPPWYAGSNIEMAFGQGATQITPIQLADAYATFANGGTRYQPQLVHDIVSPEGKVVKSFAPVVTGHVSMSAANRAAMLQGFIGVVQNPKGTAYNAGAFKGFDFSKLDVAGKTGTASTNHPVPDSLFVAFAGKDINHPQYVVAAVIEQAGYGAADAAPVAAQALQYLEKNPPGAVTPPKPTPVLIPELTPAPKTLQPPKSKSTVPSSTTTTVRGASGTTGSGRTGTSGSGSTGSGTPGTTGTGTTGTSGTGNTYTTVPASTPAATYQTSPTYPATTQPTAPRTQPTAPSTQPTTASTAPPAPNPTLPVTPTSATRTTLPPASSTPSASSTSASG